VRGKKKKKNNFTVPFLSMKSKVTLDEAAKKPEIEFEKMYYSSSIDQGTSSQLKEIFHAPEFVDFVDSYMCDVFFLETETFDYSPLFNCEQESPLSSTCDDGFQCSTFKEDSSVLVWGSPKQKSFVLERTKKSRRLVWTKELHRLFLEVVKELGETGSFYPF